MRMLIITLPVVLAWLSARLMVLASIIPLLEATSIITFLELLAIVVALRLLLVFSSRGVFLWPILSIIDFIFSVRLLNVLFSVHRLRLWLLRLLALLVFLLFLLLKLLPFDLGLLLLVLLRHLAFLVPALGFVDGFYKCSDWLGWLTPTRLLLFFLHFFWLIRLPDSHLVDFLENCGVRVDHAFFIAISLSELDLTHVNFIFNLSVLLSFIALHLNLHFKRWKQVFLHAEIILESDEIIEFFNLGLICHRNFRNIRSIDDSGFFSVSLFFLFCSV